MRDEQKSPAGPTLPDGESARKVTFRKENTFQIELK